MMKERKVQRIACIGECMIEMCEQAPRMYAMGFGGDSANTAVYLARLLGADGVVDYFSALGDDPYSEEMRDFLCAEGVGMNHTARLPGRTAGLYLIRTDERGERTFQYYRSNAAARDMLRGKSGAVLLGALERYDWIYLSGISLSILDDVQRGDLVAALKAARAGGTRVVFDGNYRAQGWPDVAAARAAFDAVLAVSTVALVTFSDERIVYADATAEDAVARLRRAGVCEGAVKLGARGCLVFDDDREIQVPAEQPVNRPLDTTAAGDAFNAAYLGARMGGLGLRSAGEHGNRLAGRVIMYNGAIIPRAALGGE